MTWSVVNTIPYVSTASNHTAMVYLFDTMFANATGWTVQAHPSASSFRRRLKFTVSNRVTNSNYTMYHWVDWQSTSPSNIIWYEDATYTTTPGDTANDTTFNVTSQVPWTSLDSWKFCTSSQNPGSILVLKGSRVAFYWPGITEGVFYPDANWTAGSTDNKGTWIAPYTGYYYGGLVNTNAPVSTNTSTSQYFMLPDAGWTCGASSSGYRIGGSYIITNFNWLYCQNSASSFYGDLSTSYAFSNGGHTDAGVFVGTSFLNQTDCRSPFNYNSNGITLQVGSNYWYKSYSDLGRQDVVFNFGAVDPLA